MPDRGEGKPIEWWKALGKSRYQIALERQAIRDSESQTTKTHRRAEDLSEHVKSVVRGLGAVRLGEQVVSMNIDSILVMRNIDEPIFRAYENVSAPLEEILADKIYNQIPEEERGENLEIEKQNMHLREGWVVMDPQPDKEGKVKIFRSFIQRTKDGVTSHLVAVDARVSELSLAHEQEMPK